MGKASTRAQNKYIAKAYDRINLTVPKGKKDTVQAHATAQGESVNGFINRAIDEAMERDGLERPTGAGEGSYTLTCKKPHSGPVEGRKAAAGEKEMTLWHYRQKTNGTPSPMS